ncbi:hypothetical protein BT96DRAFT_991572 [Gymnopus androsaceus JB14]|uniref:ABM domain-containing protein n=1 Tax=Gymnopus androsaceus JB14 TaxID=1447944 RepID=A0A6A4HZN6_9AGAR|nr:hypothetical protein BT96DRAFT_991572 [Gymnopus androsaceus JB14]
MSNSTFQHGLMLYLHITVDPSRIDEYLEHLQPIHKAVSAEPDCALFTVSVNRETGEIRMTQSWNRDREWFSEVQAKKAYYEPFIAATKSMWTKPRVVEVQERLGSQWEFQKVTNFEGA